MKIAVIHDYADVFRTTRAYQRLNGVTPKDVDVFATYDSFSVHLLASLEGFGFCGEGEAGAFVQGGRIEIGGAAVQHERRHALRELQPAGLRPALQAWLTRSALLCPPRIRWRPAGKPFLLVRQEKR